MLVEKLQAMHSSKQMYKEKWAMLVRDVQKVRYENESVTSEPTKYECSQHLRSISCFSLSFPFLQNERCHQFGAPGFFMRQNGIAANQNTTAECYATIKMNVSVNKAKFFHLMRSNVTNSSVKLPTTSTYLTHAARVIRNMRRVLYYV